MVIEVLPDFENKRWNIVFNGEVLGATKASYDADYNARLLSLGMLDGAPDGALNADVDNHYSDRAENMRRMKENKK